MSGPVANLPAGGERGRTLPKQAVRAACLEMSMKLRSLSIAVALLLLALFAMLNWDAFLAPATLSLGVAQVQAPLGLLMLGVTAAISGLFLAYILFHQASVIWELRRAAKELKAQRELAERAETSRLAELRRFFEEELRRLEMQAAASASSLDERIQQIGGQLQRQVHESTLTLSACLGELEDKLDRALPPPSAG